LLIALICLDIRIPVCRRYKIKEDTGATCVYRSDRDAYVHRTHTSPTTPYAHTHPGPHPCTPPVTPSGRATFPSGQNTVSNPKAPDLSLGDLSDPILRIFMIFDDFWTLRDTFLKLPSPFCLPFPSRFRSAPVNIHYFTLFQDLFACFFLLLTHDFP
jgi:hypothetical protein